MRKQTFILSFVVSAFLFGAHTESIAQSHKSKVSSKSNVSVVQSISPASYTADGKPMVVVSLSIKKNAYKGGTGRIEETFPENMQAMLISSGFATFQGGNGKAVFMWNSVPEDRQINVSYAIVANSTGASPETVAGQFYYQNQSFKIDPATFALTVDPSLVSHQSAVPTNTSSLDDIYYSVTGSYPQSAYTNSAPVAIAPVNNNPITPSNITASAATPTHAEQQGMTAAASAQQHTAAPAPDQQQAASSAAQQTTTASSTGITQQNTEMASSDAQTGTQQSEAAAKQQPTQQTENSNPSNAVSGNSKTQDAPAAASANAKATSSASAANGDLVYRVQVIVVGSKLRLHRFFRKHGISDEAIYDPADDLPVRVMVGSYPDYKSAKIRCTELISKGVKGAFVVSYYMGKRISVAQAATMAK